MVNNSTPKPNKRMLRTNEGSVCGYDDSIVNVFLYDFIYLRSIESKDFKALNVFARSVAIINV